MAVVPAVILLRELIHHHNSLSLAISHSALIHQLHLIPLAVQAAEVVVPSVAEAAVVPAQAVAEAVTNFTINDLIIDILKNLPWSNRPGYFLTLI